MVHKDRDVRNAARREYLAQQDRKTKAKAKLARRLATKKAESQDSTGELRQQRLAKNVPRTVENTKQWIGEDASLTKAAVTLSQETQDDGSATEGDKRTQPVQLKAGQGSADGDEGLLEFDMAGLEDMFTSQDPSAPLKPILLTTSPRPHGPTYAFLEELQSLLGGNRYAEIFPRKNSRFELSRVCKWAVKRGYGAIMVVGEDLHGGPATLTISTLPYGPTAHFRLTNIHLRQQIAKAAKPTSHIPELVLSNFSTPLGLTTGRLLQSLFPPLPNFVGRQVVAVHNQRDYIFFRRFRYMFALRETESSMQLAKSRGLDEQLRTRMQEIGPRFTLKLRWLKRGSLGSGRVRGASGVTQGSDDLADAMARIDIPELRDSHITEREVQQEALAQAEFTAGMEAALKSGLEAGPSGSPTSGGKVTPSGAEAEGGDSAMHSPPTEGNKSLDRMTSGSLQSVESEPVQKKRKRGKGAPTSDGRSFKIPHFEPHPVIPKGELPHQRKPKTNASVLDSLAVHVGYGRGGTQKSKLEWEWDPRMQVSRKRFAL